MRQANSAAWWNSEVEFIEKEAKNPQKMGMFPEYCAMQAKFANLDGFPAVADRIIAAGKE